MYRTGQSHLYGPELASRSATTYHNERQRHGHEVTGQDRDRVLPERVPNGLVVTEKAALERLHRKEEDEQRYGHWKQAETRHVEAPLGRNGRRTLECCHVTTGS